MHILAIFLNLFFALDALAEPATVPEGYIKQAEHCGALLLLRDPALEFIPSLEAPEEILPVFEGISSDADPSVSKTVKMWFSEDVWEPGDYWVYGIRDRETAINWITPWEEYVQAYAHLLAYNVKFKDLTPQRRLKPEPRLPWVSSIASDARTALGKFGQRGGAVFGTSLQDEGFRETGESAAARILGAVALNRLGSRTFPLPDGPTAITILTVPTSNPNAQWAVFVVVNRNPICGSR